jgi:hypothetical protein
LHQTARVSGVILDKNNQAVPNVNISTLGAGAQSNGFYSLTAPANKKIVLVFTAYFF